MADVDNLIKLAVETGNDKFLILFTSKLAEKLEEPNANLALIMKRLAERLEVLTNENFKLSAGVCEYRSGNEHGNAICLKTGELL